MELKSETRQFGELSVTVNEFDAWRAFQLLPRLGQILGAISPGNDIAGIDFAKTVPALCRAIVTDEKLLLDLLASTTVQTDKAAFGLTDKDKINAAFTGRLWDMAQVLRMVLEVNFSDFLSSMLAEIAPGEDSEKESPAAKP